MNVMMVRSLKGYPDSRVEKELYSISKEHKISLFGWNRYESSDKITEEIVNVFGCQVKYFHYNHVAPIGLGFRKLFLPLIKFWKAEHDFLKENHYCYDVIHACDFDTVLPAYFIARKYKKKLVYDIFDYYADAHSGPLIVKKMISTIENSIIGKSDVTIICSDKRKEQIKGSNPKTLVVIHNSPMDIENQVMGKICIESSEKMKLAYVGLLSEDRYLKEIAEVIINRSDIEWHVGGWGPLKSYFEKLAEQNASINYYGEVPYSEAIDIEKQCDILTALYNPYVPNHKYAAPNKFYEALMLGKPLIMIRNTGVDGYVLNNELGVVIDLDKGEFIKLFDEALDIIKEMNNDEINKRARLIYRKMFSWNEMEERLLEAYRNISL